MTLNTIELGRNNLNFLVTGAAGFIGFHLCQNLLSKGHMVLGLDNLNDYYDVQLKYARLNELGIYQNDATYFNKVSTGKIFNERFSFIRCNIEDRENLPKLFDMYKFDFVINLAAQAGVRYSIENPETYVDSNLVGFANIIECCRNYNIRHLVYASSSSVYGENAKVPFNTEDRADYPVSLYAATKRCNELMAYTYSHLYGIRTTGLRFFTVYGPWGRPDMAPMLFANAISNNERIRIFNNGNMSRDFTYIDDIIKGIEIVIGYHAANSNHHPGFRIFNIGNGHPEKLLDFVETLESSLGIVGDKELIAMQPGDVTKTWADIIEMEKLGYRSTTSINDGIGKFVNWYSNYYNKEK